MPVGPVRVFNSPNPYLAEHRELIGEPPPAELEVYEDWTSSPTPQKRWRPMGRGRAFWTSSSSPTRRP